MEKPQLKEKIQTLLQHIQLTICSNLPHAFWNRKKHIVDLPYEKDFNEKQTPTKARVPKERKISVISKKKLLCNNKIN